MPEPRRKAAAEHGRWAGRGGCEPRRASEMALLLGGRAPLALLCPFPALCLKPAGHERRPQARSAGAWRVCILPEPACRALVPVGFPAWHSKT